MGPLKLDFLGIYLTKCSESVTSEIQKLSGTSFCSKYSKFNLDFKNAAKNRKKCFVLEIIASGLVSLNRLYKEQDTFYRKSMS